MNEIYELKEKLLKELEEYGRKGDLSTGSLEVVDKLAHSVKNLCKILEESDEGGRSYADGRMYGGEGRSYGDGMYLDGRSYARGRRGNVRRDAMGRYSNNGYSYDGEDMADQLRDLMNDAPDHIKSDIQRLINKVEKM